MSMEALEVSFRDVCGWNCSNVMLMPYAPKILENVLRQFWQSRPQKISDCVKCFCAAHNWPYDRKTNIGQGLGN